MERSAKLVSPDRARAEQCRHLARGERFGACAWPRTSASVGSVKPGLLFCDAHGVRVLPSRDSGVAISFLPRSGHLFMPDPRALKPLENLDGWIAPKTSDEDGSSNVRARVAQAPPGMT